MDGPSANRAGLGARPGKALRRSGPRAEARMRQALEFRYKSHDVSVSSFSNPSPAGSSPPGSSPGSPISKAASPGWRRPLRLGSGAFLMKVKSSWAAGSPRESEPRHPSRPSLPAPASHFGFAAFAEAWNGCLAMVGSVNGDLLGVNFDEYDQQSGPNISCYPGRIYSTLQRMNQQSCLMKETNYVAC